MKDNREISSSVLYFGYNNFPLKYLLERKSILCYLERDEMPQTTNSVVHEPVAMMLFVFPSSSLFLLLQHVFAFLCVKRL